MIILSESIFKYKGHKTFHLSSTESLDELFEFSKTIGLNRAWFQDKQIPHFDIFRSKIHKAIASGAVEVTSRKFLELAIRQGESNGNRNNKRRDSFSS